LTSSAAILAKGILNAMAVSKMRMSVALIVTLGLLAGGAGWAAHQRLQGKPTPEQRNDAPRPVGTKADAPKSAETKEETKDYYGDPLPPGVLARMGTVQLRHGYADVAFSADGKTLISATSTIRFWDLATGKETQFLKINVNKPSDQPTFFDCTLSLEGKFLAARHVDEIEWYATDTGKLLHRIATAEHAYEGVRFSPNGKVVAAKTRGESPYTIQLWDAGTGKEKTAFRHKDWVSSFAISNDGLYLASLTSENTLHLWDAITGKEKHSTTGDSTKLVFAPNGETLATAFRDGSVTLWDSATLMEKAKLRSSKRGQDVADMKYSPDGKWLAVVGDADVVLWNLATEKEERRLPQKGARNIAFAPDSKTLACAGKYLIRLWDITTGKELYSRPGHDNQVYGLAASPDGKLLASTCSEEPSIHIWDANSGKPLCQIGVSEEGLRNCVFSNDTKAIIAFDRPTGDVCYFERDTGKVIRRFPIEDLSGRPRRRSDVISLRLSDDEKHLAAISMNGDMGNHYQMNLFDAQSGKPLVRRPLEGDWFHSRFSRDGIAVSLDTKSGLRIENTKSGRALAFIPGSVGRAVVFSPDGKLVAVTMIETYPDDERSWHVLGIRVAEIASGKEVFHADGDFSWFLDFSSDGRQLAGADPEGLGVWDVLTGKRLLKRTWPKGFWSPHGFPPFVSFVYVPKRNAVATGMRDGTVLVWDLFPETWPQLDTAKGIAAKDLDCFWADLAGEDLPKAYRAIHALVESRALSVPFLVDRLKAAAETNTSHLPRLLAELDSDQFETREKANKELAKLREEIEPALRNALEGKPSEEVRRRVKELLDLPRAVPSDDVLRTLRAIQVLERIGTKEASEALKKLSTGAEAARETRAAKEALERLSHKNTADR
jgi:WD40 repeat protein